MLYPSPGRVVINEIMYRPAAGGEWVELASLSSGSVDISGWRLADRAGSSGTVPEGTLIGAGGYLVIAADPGSVAGGAAGLEGGWPRLNDGDGSGTAEDIFLFDREGGLAESVSYRSLCGDERGRSIERVDPRSCSADSRGIWLRCASPAGSTPGRENYSFTGAGPSSGISADPDPFRNISGSAVRFSVAAAQGDITYCARIFDMEGRENARLAAGPVSAPVITFLWDGTGPGGRRAGTGLYIVIVEFTCGGGGICRREKRTLAVWSEE